MHKLFIILLSLPKTFFWNIKIFGLKGLKLPILIKYDTKMDIKGNVTISQQQKTFESRIGFGGSDGIHSLGNCFLHVSDRSQLIMGKAFKISQGGRIFINNNGIVEIGDNFFSNKNVFISCDKSIKIGSDVILGWNVAIRDSDGHEIIENGIIHNNTGKVNIGNHVWLASEVHVLKNTSIGEGCVVGYRSTINKHFDDVYSLIVGTPARVVRKNIQWRV